MFYVKHHSIPGVASNVIYSLFVSHKWADWETADLLEAIYNRLLDKSCDHFVTFALKGTAEK